MSLILAAGRALFGRRCRFCNGQLETQNDFVVCKDCGAMDA